MLVFFPSYTQMASFIDFWKTPTAKHREPFWSILEREKRIFVEPRDKMDIPALFREFDLVVRTSSTGALLLAVCRGKVAFHTITL
jgi:Rad3-related DNA helicase